jgi:hypothetical protein
MTKNFIRHVSLICVYTGNLALSGLLYDRRTAVVVNATSYGLPHFRLENIRSRIFGFHFIVMVVMTCEVRMSIFLKAHDYGS